jgi:hypothetical protein
MAYSVCCVDNGSEGRDCRDGDRPRRRQTRHRRRQADLRRRPLRPHLRHRQPAATRPVQVAVRLAGVVVVRCYSSRRGPHGIIVRRYSVDEIDAIAAYCFDTDRCYLLPPRLFAGRRTVHLRLAPSLNNQRALINWASDFELAATLDPSHGAIAQLGERLDGIQKVAGSSPAGSTLTEPPPPGHLRCRQAV